MASQSALINVMQKASTYASRGMLRDFGEVENLQVSRKGPADFVSRADINAEKTIRKELSKARPGWGFVTSAISMTGVILTAGFSMFPFIMPSSTAMNSSLTVWDAPSSHLTLTVMFWAAAIFVPIILAYTTWTYRAMWGRVTVRHIRDNTHSAY